MTANEPDRTGLVPPSRSLLVRTTLVLGIGLALAAGVLVLLFGPYLSGLSREGSDA